MNMHWAMARRGIFAAFAVSAMLGPGSASSTNAQFVSATPTKRVDYWQQRMAGIEAQLHSRNSLSGIKLAFIGDSITDFWLLDANPWIVGKWCGRAIWDESFAGTRPDHRAINLAVSGDRTEHVLFRLQPRAKGGLGQLDRADLKPDFIIIMVGINNSFDAEKPAVDSIFAGAKAIVAAAHARKPGARIILQSLLPTDDAVKNRDIVVPVNALLAKLAAAPGAKVAFLDLYRDFVDADGKQRAELFNDGLHPSRDGYRLWRDRLVPFLDQQRRKG